LNGPGYRTFNNPSLGMVKLEMRVTGIPDFETDHASVDYAAIAQAAGIHAVRIEQPKDIGRGSRCARPSGAPALVDLVTFLRRTPRQLLP
jgi:pyruvate dehydrogenase (quinone)